MPKIHSLIRGDSELRTVEPDYLISLLLPSSLLPSILHRELPLFPQPPLQPNRSRKHINLCPKTPSS